MLAVVVPPSKHLKGRLDPPVSDGSVCLFVTFLFFPALLPSPVQRRLDPRKNVSWPNDPVYALPAVGRLWPSDDDDQDQPALQRDDYGDDDHDQDQPAL